MFISKKCLHIISLCMSLFFPRANSLTASWINLELDNEVFISSPIKTVSKIQCVVLATQSSTIVSFTYQQETGNCYLYTQNPDLGLMALPDVLLGAKTYIKLGIQDLQTLPTIPTTTLYQPLTSTLTSKDLCNSKNGYTYVSSSNGCYKIVITLKSLTTANNTCIADGGYLMRLNTDAKKDWLDTQLKNKGVTVWLGGSKDKATGTWYWDSGEVINLSFFKDVQRINIPTLDCVTFTDIFFSSYMDANTCVLLYGIACEIPLF